jgi:hypothetical protein
VVAEHLQKHVLRQLLGSQHDLAESVYIFVGRRCRATSLVDAGSGTRRVDAKCRAERRAQLTEADGECSAAEARDEDEKEQQRHRGARLSAAAAELDGSRRASDSEQHSFGREEGEREIFKYTRTELVAKS